MHTAAAAVKTGDFLSLFDIKKKNTPKHKHTALTAIWLQWKLSDIKWTQQIWPFGCKFHNEAKFAWMKSSPHYSVFIFLKHNLNPCLSCRWRMTGSTWQWSLTGFSCGFSWRCACWEHWDSSSSRSSASWNETLPFLFCLFNLPFFFVHFCLTSSLNYLE